MEKLGQVCDAAILEHAIQQKFSFDHAPPEPNPDASGLMSRYERFHQQLILSEQQSIRDKVTGVRLLILRSLTPLSLTARLRLHCYIPLSSADGP